MAEDNDEKRCRCAELKYPMLDAISEIPSVTLPIVGTLSASADFTVSTPSNCSLAFNLLIKLNPLLANLKCVSNILGVIIALKKFATNPLTNGSTLLDAISKAENCLKPFVIPNICIALTIYDSLNLMIKVLGCLIEQLDSLFKFQAILDREAAKSEPALNFSLECARLNLETSQSNMKQSLDSIVSTITLITGLLDLAELSGIVNLPDSTELMNLKINLSDPTGTVGALKSVLVALEKAVDAINKAVNINMIKSLCTPS